MKERSTDIFIKWEAVVHTAGFFCAKGEVKLNGRRQQGGIFVQFSQI